jgi:hypothetical protein
MTPKELDCPHQSGELLLAPSESATLDSLSDPIEQKFIRLRDDWKSQRSPASSTIKLVMHPAYQTIIGMGSPVVPLLLRELETNLDSWFWALRAITEADPVSEADRGDGQAMAKAWLEWGKKQSYKW